MLNTYLPKWLIFALLSAFFASLTAIFGKIGVSHINANLATFIRTIIIVLITLAVVCIRHDWQKISFNNTYDIIFLVLSATATGLSWLCYYHALKLGNVSKVAPIDKLSVALTIFLSIVILKEQITWSLVLGATLIIAGSLIIAIF